MKKRVMVIAIIGVAIIATMVTSYCVFMNKNDTALDRNGYTVDWDDPWVLDDGVYYFCEIKNSDGSIQQRWLKKSIAETMVEVKKVGLDFYVAP